MTSNGPNEFNMRKMDVITLERIVNTPSSTAFGEFLIVPLITQEVGGTTHVQSLEAIVLAF